MLRSRHMGWMVEMGKIPILPTSECARHQGNCRVGCGRVKKLQIYNLRPYLLNVGLITLNNIFTSWMLT